MSRALSPFLKTIWWVLTFRPLRLLLATLIIWWTVDRALVFVTDGAYFTSLGLGETFWRTRLLALVIFMAFFAGALLLAIPFLRASAKPVSGTLATPEIPLRLSFLDEWHARAPKLSWFLVVLAAFWGAHRLENLWPQFDTILGATWNFTLILILVVALGGGVRALPFLADKKPTTPARWIRALKILAVWALGLRALGYAQALAFAPLTGFELWIGRPLAIMGIALVALVIFQILRGKTRQKIGGALMGALFLPAVLGIILQPFFFWLPSPRQRVETEPKQGLQPLRPGVPGVPVERGFPVWSESLLVQNARAQVVRDGKNLVDWRNAALFFDGQIWRAGVVGTAPQSGGLLPDLQADERNAQSWLALDLSRISEGSPARGLFAPAKSVFYGLEGAALFGNDKEVGAPFSALWKTLWALRLKSPTLPLEGARFERILLFRGVEESAQLVWQELEWKNPRPFWNAEKSGWLWLCEGWENGQKLVYALQDPGSGRLEFRLAPGAPNENGFRERTMNLFAANEVPFEADEILRADETQKLGASDFEVWKGLGKIWAHELGNRRERFTANLEALDAAARAEFAPKNGARLEKGVPTYYPDARAPGGAWVARGYFATQTENGGPSARLWRVGISGFSASPLGFGETTEDALRDFGLKTRLQDARKSPTPSGKLEIQALEFQRRAEAALRAGKYGDWARANEKIKAILEELAKR